MTVFYRGLYGFYEALTHTHEKIIHPSFGLRWNGAGEWRADNITDPASHLQRQSVGDTGGNDFIYRLSDHYHNSQLSRRTEFKFSAERGLR